MSERYELLTATWDGVDIKGLITDIEIYEHLDKSYVTGNVSFLDSIGAINQIKPTGTEEFVLSVRLPQNKTAPVTKVFIADYIVDVTKQNDLQQLVVFHIIEKVGFDTISINVNKAYNGYGREIIEKIVKEFHGEYKVATPPDGYEDKFNIKVIVPNMTPLEACKWICNRTTTIDGMPFYFFSTFALKDTFNFLSLKKLFEAESIHGKREYVYSQSKTSDSMQSEPGERPFIISAYSETGNKDTASLIDASLIQSDYHWWDTFTATDSYYDWSILPVSKKLPNTYSVDVAAKSQTRTTILQPTMSYDGFETYRESKLTANYKKMSDAKGLANLITANSINIGVAGTNFLDAKYNKTIGNTINVRFLNSLVTASGKTLTKDEATDKEKSGKFLIYAARHNLRVEKYDVTLSCVKLGDLVQ